MSKKYATEDERKTAAREASKRRQAAFRERNDVLEIRLTPKTAATLRRMAEYFDVPRTEVVNSLINFALLNRNWFTLGLFGKPLPRALPTDPASQKQVADFEAFMSEDNER